MTEPSSSYLSRAFEELFHEDGLCVMARGCGINKILAKFVQYYSCGTPADHTSPEEKKKLVFVLNLAGQEQLILDHLLADGVPPHCLPRVITSENVSSQERAELFLRGGCFIITSRLLIIDLLEKKLAAHSIMGMLVANAHKVTETSLETFILRVYREGHHHGFIKAFSEDPESLTGSFGKIDRSMRMLWLQKLYLWPRFHEAIVNVLDHSQPEVIEILQPLSNSMKTIQSALLVALSTTINELRKAVPALETTHMSLENGLSVGFDRMLQTQLDPEWHRLSERTKRLVSDTKSLRVLLEYLIKYDTVSFYFALLRLRADSIAREGFSPSLWLSSDAAEVIFRCARDRVFQVVEISSPAPAPDAKTTVIIDADTYADPTLALSSVFGLKSCMRDTGECPPKWRLLLNTVLQEAREAYQDRKQELENCRAARRAIPISSDASEGGNEFEHEDEDEEELNGRVLILFKDEDTRIRVKDSLIVGPEHVLKERYKWFVGNSAAEIKAKVQASKGGYAGRSGSAAKNQNQQYRTSAFEPAFGAYPTPTPNPAQGKDNDKLSTSDISFTGLTSQQLASLNVDSRMMLMEDTILTRKATQEARKALGLSADASKGNEDSAVILKRAREKASTRQAKPTERSRKSAKVDNRSSSSSKTSCGDESDEDNVDTDNDSIDSEALFGHSIHQDLHIHLLTHQQAADRADVLGEIDPFVVVLYDPDVSMVRRMEVFHAKKEAEYLERKRERQKNKRYIGHDSDKLFSTWQRTKVYFLIYNTSTEEHRYVNALAKEKKAFESLVISKGKMAVCLPDLPQDLLALRAEEHTYSVDSRTVNRGNNASSSSSSNGLVTVGNNLKKVVIDVREFRCPLPSLLHSSGMYIIARTVAVGDYILAPEVCVERKSISDLFGSFQSGRLFNQAEAMSRHYKHPCLLIEFTDQQSFSFGELADDLRNDSIQSRLTTLSIAFPGLRYLWARSIHSTTEIFKAIMAGHDPVDEEKAIFAGSASAATGGASSTNVDEQEARSAAHEMLLSLPGINVHNVRAVMDGVESLADLACRSELDLASLVGTVNAKALFAFMNQRAI